MHSACERSTKNDRLEPRDSSVPMVVADSATTANVNAPAMAAVRPTAMSSMRAISREIETLSLKEPSLIDAVAARPSR
jgi:hypothetical protein